MASNWNQASAEDARRGAVIKEIRESAGLTAREVGAAARISAAYIYMIENGHRPVPLKTCRRLATALKVSVSRITVENYTETADAQAAL